MRSATGHLDALAAHSPESPVAAFAQDALRFYFEFHQQYDGFYGAFVHDPFVVAATLDPELVRGEPASVDVDASRGPGDGQTIADWRHTTAAPTRTSWWRATQTCSSTGWSIAWAASPARDGARRGRAEYRPRRSTRPKMAGPSGLPFGTFGRSCGLRAARG
ncbi:MAG: nucleoside hydrolase [Chloroflexota bacterium]